MKRGGFLKDLAVMGGASGFSQALTIAASPILTRIFSPDEYGAFALFVAILGVVGGFTCMKYEFALPLARDELEAANIFALCGAILCVFFIVFCAGVWAVQDVLFDWLNAPTLHPYLWLLPICVFVIGVANMAHHWAIRKKHFKRLATTTMMTSIVVLLFQICVGIMRAGPAGLIFGRIAGLVFNSIALLYPVLTDVKSLLRNVSRKGVIGVAKKHRQFPYFLTFSSTISSLSQAMPIIILSMFFGPTVAGLWALSRRMMGLPTTLIGEEIRKVFYPYAAELPRIEDLRDLTTSVFTYLVQVALPVFFIIGLVAPELFSLVFGERWRDAGTYAQWLSPAMFMAFIIVPLTRLPLILGRQMGELIFQIVFLVARGSVLIVGGVAFDVSVTIALFASISVLCLVGFMTWSMNLIGIGSLKILSILSKEFLISTPIVAPLVVAKLIFVDADDGLWVVATAVGCALAAAIVLLARNRHHISFLFGFRSP